MSKLETSKRNLMNNLKTVRHLTDKKIVLNLDYNAYSYNVYNAVPTILHFRIDYFSTASLNTAIAIKNIQDVVGANNPDKKIPIMVMQPLVDALHIQTASKLNFIINITSLQQLRSIVGIQDKMGLKQLSVVLTTYSTDSPDYVGLNYEDLDLCFTYPSIEVLGIIYRYNPVQTLTEGPTDFLTWQEKACDKDILHIAVLETREELLINKEISIINTVHLGRTVFGFVGRSFKLGLAPTTRNVCRVVDVIRRNEQVFCLLDLDVLSKNLLTKHIKGFYFERQNKFISLNDGFSVSLNGLMIRITVISDVNVLDKVILVPNDSYSVYSEDHVPSLSNEEAHVDYLGLPVLNC